MEEKIIEFLKSSGGQSFYQEDFLNKLNLSSDEEAEELLETLNELSKKGILYHSEKKNKYCLFEDSHLYKGKVDMTQGGDAFVIVDNLSTDIHINQKFLNGAIDEDIVTVEIIKKFLKGKPEGKIVSVIERKNNFLVGEIYTKNGVNYLKEIGKKESSKDMIIDKSNIGDAVDGNFVKVELIRGNKETYAKVVEVTGHKNNPGDDIKAFIYKYKFFTDFNEEVKESLPYIPNTITAEELNNELKRGRIDLRGEVITTMDGADTKDIDDAISIKKLPNGNYLLGVHIADVSYYVKEKSIIDEEAYKRATSNYLVDRVLPMLPHKLSNGICSLNPKEDRFALSCMMEVNEKGEVVDYEIFESVIRSCLKMTYEKVNEILDNDLTEPKNNDIKINDNDNEEETYKQLTDYLKHMRILSNTLMNKMIRRGYIEFESDECKILVNEQGVPYDIKLRTQGTGEKIIETFMIAANETVATSLYSNDLPDIFRVHDHPNDERLEQFITFLTARGIVMEGNSKENWTALDFQKLIHSLKDRPDSRVLSDMAIRSQSKAIYSSFNIGHFGLGSKCYSHFTSPIRRYPDLTQHRIVKDFNYLYDPDIAREKLSMWGVSLGNTCMNVEKTYSEEFNSEITKKVNKWDSILPELSNHCSEREKDADNLEREVEKMKKAEYMEQHIGEIYVGIVSGITNFGMFVALENTVEGMIRFEYLPKDNYTYDEKTQILYGKSGKKYQIGDILEVRVIAACKDNMTVDFALNTKENNYEVSDNPKKKFKHKHK